jgi:hypothetical protein
MNPSNSSPSDLPAQIADFTARALASMADPEKARGMAAYMKTDMPFYGVRKPGRLKIGRQIKRRFAIRERRAYERVVRALWQRPHREEKYLFGREPAASFRPQFQGRDQSAAQTGMQYLTKQGRAGRRYDDKRRSKGGTSVAAG